MKRSTRGCGVEIAVLILVSGAGAIAFFKFGLPWWRSRARRPSGGELQVHVLDVGPIEGDSILIISPTGKSVLIDSGDAGKGKVALDALKRYQIERLDYFIATHPHSDHIGGAAEIMNSVKVGAVIDNGVDLSTPAPEAATNTKGKGSKAKPVPTPSPLKKSKAKTATGFFDEYEAALIADGAWNRYGNPAQVVLDRLKAVDAKVYRTDLHGEVTITTRGKLNSGKLYEIKTAKEAREDIWTGREAQKDDSSRSGFVAYGDFGPPPKPPKEKKKGE